MKKASITEAKNNLSALIAGLNNGPVMILDRGRPVARLEAAELQDDPDGRLERLVRKGIVTPPRRPGKLPKDFWTRPLPRLPKGASVLEALLEERRDGR